MDLEICKSSMFVLQLCGKKEKPFLTIKKAKNRIFPKGLTHAFGPKNANFYFVSVKTRLVIVLLNDFVEKKETFLSIKKKRIFQILKNHIFPKGLTPVYKQKMPISSLFRFIKIRLEIMLKEFADKKETFLDYKKQNFQKSKNSYFAKGVNSRFWSEKCQFFLYLFLVKTRLEIILNAFVEKKETFFDYNKLSQKLLFPKGLSHALVTKCQFFCLC